jgi:hypothetical protein
MLITSDLEDNKMEIRKFTFDNIVLRPDDVKISYIKTAALEKSVIVDEVDKDDPFGFLFHRPKLSRLDRYDQNVSSVNVEDLKQAINIMDSVASRLKRMSYPDYHPY